MIVTLNTRSLCSLVEVRAFLDGTVPVGFVAPAGADRLCWLADTLRQFHYRALRRPDKRVLLAFLLKVSGLSRAGSRSGVPVGASWTGGGHRRSRS